MNHDAAIEVLNAEALRLQRQQIQLDRAWSNAIRQPARTYSPADVDAAEQAQQANRHRISSLRATARELERSQNESPQQYAARIR